MKIAQTSQQLLVLGSSNASSTELLQPVSYRDAALNFNAVQYHHQYHDTNSLVKTNKRGRSFSTPLSSPSPTTATPSSHSSISLSLQMLEEAFGNHCQSSESRSDDDCVPECEEEAPHCPPSTSLSSSKKKTPSRARKYARTDEDGKKSRRSGRSLSSQRQEKQQQPSTSSFSSLEENTIKTRNNNSVAFLPKKKHVTFSEVLVTEVRTRPRTDPRDKPMLFYSNEDERRFRNEYHNRNHYYEDDENTDINCDVDVKPYDVNSPPDLIDEECSPNIHHQQYQQDHQRKRRTLFGDGVVTRAVVVDYAGTTQTFYDAITAKKDSLLMSPTPSTMATSLPSCGAEASRILSSNEGEEQPFDFDNSAFWNGTVMWY